MFKETAKKISSLNNPLLKQWVKIRQKKSEREKHRSVIVSGKKLIQELAEIIPPKRVFITQPVFKLPRAVETFYVTDEMLKKITGLRTVEEMAAEFPLPSPSSLKGKQPILALDRIADPGNLGTLLRTAHALGWEGIFLLPNCVDPFNDKVVRASRGALFSLSWYMGQWDEISSLIQINKLTPYVADAKGLPLTSFKPKRSSLLLLSNEAKGISQRGKELGERVAIPMQGKTESLNVAVAGSILMYFLRPPS